MQKFPWQAFARNSAYANQIALRNSQGDPFTWMELAEKINQVEAFLLQEGVTTQSAVAFCGKNSEQNCAKSMGWIFVIKPKIFII